MKNATTVKFSRKTKSAAALYIARRDRMAHPDGGNGKGRKWHPSADERCSCCSSVRSPSWAYPWSLMTHCRTAAHIANLAGVDVSELRAAARALDTKAKAAVAKAAAVAKDVCHG